MIKNMVLWFLKLVLLSFFLDLEDIRKDFMFKAEINHE